MVNLQREIVTGLVSVRVLHSATRGPVSGVELSEDLARVGHRISPGTLYPLLHQLEKSGWLKSTGKTVKGKRRKYYRLTKKGRVQLESALATLEQFMFGILDLQSVDAQDPVPISSGASLVRDGLERGASRANSGAASSS